MILSRILLTALSTHAFSPFLPRDIRFAATCRPHSHCPGPLRSRGEGNDGGDNGDVEDSMLEEELRRAKKDRFGADIPASDELDDAARDAENSFLAAMLEETRKFREIKSDQGSEKAVESFMKMIQEEDEAAARSGGGLGHGGQEGESFNDGFEQGGEDSGKESEDKIGGTMDNVDNDSWQ